MDHERACHAVVLCKAWQVAVNLLVLELGEVLWNGVFKNLVEILGAVSKAVLLSDLLLVGMHPLLAIAHHAHVCCRGVQLVKLWQLTKTFLPASAITCCCRSDHGQNR